jgi:hypothetical protein
MENIPVAFNVIDVLNVEKRFHWIIFMKLVNPVSKKKLLKWP